MQGLVSYFADKKKCDPFVRGSGSAKSYSLGWQFLSFSSKRHINTRLLTLLKSCVAAIWQPVFLRIVSPHKPTQAYCYWLTMCILQNLRPSGILFSKETVCEKFQIAREKQVVTVTTTFKSGGDTVSYTHLTLPTKRIV